MSSQTPNLNLVLPVGTEKVSRQIINDNNTKIDTAVGSNSTAISKVQNGLAFIVGNTNTTGGTLAVGQFVYVKNHSTIAEGLRTVTASISANGNITTSNTSECSDGGLNALNSNYAFYPTVNSEVVDSGTINGIGYGKVCKMTYYIRFKTAGSGWANVATIPAGYIPTIQQYGICAVDASVSAGEGKIAETRVLTDGRFEIYSPVAGAYLGEIVYICS